MPVVLLAAKSQTSDVDCVKTDHVSLGRLLAEKIIEAGHERIAAIVQFPEDVAWVGPMEGYRQAHEAAGLEADLSLIRHKSRAFYPDLINDLFKAKPTALFAITTSDHAIILSTLHAMGCQVPRDLSYVGWAQSYTAALFPYPTITCLDDVYPAMARTALHRLFDRIEDPLMPAENVIVPVGIRKGETLQQRKDQ